jgi:hypothetical protein
MKMVEENKKESLGKKLKEGISIQELESIARKYLHEVLFILAIFIASISSIFDFFIGPMWTVTFLGLTAMVSIAFPESTSNLLKGVYHFYYKQEKVVQIIIGSVRILLALFLPFVFFAELGALAGVAFHMIPKYLLKDFGSLSKKDSGPREGENI